MLDSRRATRPRKAGERFRKRCAATIARIRNKGGAMESRNVETYRAGHEAFNRRDFDAMVKEYAETISWIDQARGITFRTPAEVEEEFLKGGIQAASDCQVPSARYTDAGETVVARFTGRGTNDGPFGPF